MYRTLTTILIAIFLIDSARAEKVKSHDLIIENAWIKDTPINHPTTSGYLTIHNNGERDEKLIDVSSSISSKIAIHQTIMHDNIIKMRPLLDGLIIPAGSTIHLNQSGFHIMFVKLKTRMIPMQTHLINLTFLNSGTLTIKAIVKSSNGINELYIEQHNH